MGTFVKQVSYEGAGPCADADVGLSFDVCAPAVAAALAGAAGWRILYKMLIIKSAFLDLYCPPTGA